MVQERQLILSEEQEGGGSLYSHLDAVRQNFNIVDPLLEPIDTPIQYLYIWEIYMEISAGRPVGMSGASRIPSTEIHAWQEINNTRLAPFELEIIRALDYQQLEFHCKKAQSNGPRPSKPVDSG